MLHFFRFALCVLSFFCACSARAEDTTTALPEVIRMDPPTTTWVVLGTSTFSKAPNIAGSEDSERQCRAIIEHLTQVGYSSSQVLSLCGTELVRERLFANLGDLANKQVKSGGTLVVVWLGGGGTDPASGTRIWSAADASFNAYTGSSDALGSSYFRSGISPSLLYQYITRFVPTNANVLFLTDSARGGTYATGSGNIELVGPSAHDFDDFPSVYALSPTPERDVPEGKTYAAITTCINPVRFSVGMITGRELINCYAEAMTGPGLTIDSMGSWSEDALIFLPQSQAPVPVAKKKVNAAKVALIAAGGAVTVAGGVGALVTYLDARQVVTSVNAGTYGAEGDPRLEDAMARYNRDRTLFLASCIAGGVGLGSVTVGIALPHHDIKATATITPTGVSVHGTF